MEKTKEHFGEMKLRLAVLISMWLFFSITNWTMAGSATFSNSTDVNIPDGTGVFVHSPITISSAPSGAIVTRIDYSFVITHAYGADLDVDINDHSRTTAIKANVWTGAMAGGTDSGINPTRSGSITSGPLIGLPVNQTWYLAAADVAGGDVGYINTWTITVYWSDAKPNLTPYTPSGWSDKIVVSKSTGNHTDSSGLTTADTLYLDWAVINNGAVASTARFYTELYVDGTLRGSWFTDPSLNVGFDAAAQDFNLGTLSAGTHTLRIITDSTSTISESSETDNEYTKTITISGISGTINSTLANISGAGYTPQNVRFVLYTSPSRQNTGNPATFSNVTTGTYLIEGYQAGSWWGEELWTSKQVAVSAGQTVNTTLIRDFPYTSAIVISNVTSGGFISAGQNINAGTQVRAYVTVRNNSGSALNSRVRFLFDINQATAYDYDGGYSSPQTVSAGGGTSVFTFNFTPTSSGQYYYAYAVQTYVNSAYVLTDSDTWRQTFNTIANYPNLNPYQPSGYSDKIVVSKVTGTHTDNSPLYSTDTLYVDWAVINNGTSATATRFTTELYVDGVLRMSWGTDPPLNVYGYAYIDDYSIGTLSAGSHTIKIKTDSTGVIPEVNESSNDNEYIKTITVTSMNFPNLSPYQPSGWSDKIVVSRSAGNNTDSGSLTTGDTLYVDWAVVNNGNAAAASSFYTYLYVDDVLKSSWITSPPLNANYYTTIFDYPIGTLSSGTHTVKITTDATGTISESNETDNSYTKTINVGGIAMPDFRITSITLNPASPQLGQTFTATVTVNNQGSGSGDGKWLDVWVNQPEVQTGGADGNAWTSVGVMTSGQSKVYTLNLTAPESAGTYMFRAFVDSYCQTAESSEANNQATLSYTVGLESQPLPNFVVTAITFNPVQPVGGQPFTAYVTVKNQGAVSGDGKYLDVWVDQPVPQSGGALGSQSRSVGTLLANQTKTLTYNLTAPPDGAPWTFRAFVDSTCQTPESIEGDNQLTANYGVNPVAQPDFTITAITISQSNLKPGDKFNAFVTVKNQGTVSGNAGWLDVWANKPATAVCGESGDSHPKIGMLAANESKVITVALIAGPAGENTLRAFVDSKCESTESNEANNQVTLSYDTSARVLLLLHGMNSLPATWDKFVKAQETSFQTIYDGVIETNLGHEDSKGVKYYALRFGSHDDKENGGYLGLDDQGGETLASSGATAGDFSDFEQLGEEIKGAIKAILNTNGASTKIVLVAHSRGGLAARAFLQRSEPSPERGAVVGFLSLGTPHLGSKLGRVYERLRQNKRTSSAEAGQDWDAVDKLRGDNWRGEPLIDVRRPVIKFVADDSPLIANLNTGIANLPPGLAYGIVHCQSVRLGVLSTGTIYGVISANYDAFDQDNDSQTGLRLRPLSQDAEDFILNESPIGNFVGDGIVHNVSQRYYQISGFPGGSIPSNRQATRTGVVHIEETAQVVSEILDVLQNMVDWWNK